MFKDTRKGTWLESIDSVLHIITRRIAELRNKYQNEPGNKIVPQVEQQFKKNWAKAAAFEVHETNNGEYLVSSCTTTRAGGHVINPLREMCTCGYWQEYQVPCVHACAYGRMKLDCEAVFFSTRYIHDIHRHSSLHELYAVNINPVILDTVMFDLQMKPNPVVKGRGRPKKGD